VGKEPIVAEETTTEEEFESGTDEFSEDSEVAELKDEIERLRVENEALNQQIATSPFATDGNYQREFDRLTRRADSAEAELDQLKKRVRDEAIERDNQENDRKAAEEARLSQFRTEDVVQDENTRFRVLGKVPAGQRDIFGDPTTEGVVTFGVNFNRYTGGLYVPVSVVIEVAQSIGMLTKEQSENLTTELKVATAKNESAGRLAEELLDGIQTCVDDFYSALDDVLDPDVSDDSNSEESNEESDGIAIEPAGQTHDTNVSEESDGVSSSSNDSESKPESETSTSTGIFGQLK
jgi:hypothetical protein